MRRNRGATFRPQVAMAAVKVDKTLDELAEQFIVHPTQITDWKLQLLARAANVFGRTKAPSETLDLKTLRAKMTHYLTFCNQQRPHRGLDELACIGEPGPHSLLLRRPQLL